jgi:hypothetical protein
MNGDSDITEMAKRGYRDVNPQDNANQEASGLSLLGQSP